MYDPMQTVRDSIALDAAYLRRGVPAMIDSLAESAMREVENAGNSSDSGNAGGKADASVVRREIDGTTDTDNVDEAKP